MQPIRSNRFTSSRATPDRTWPPRRALGFLGVAGLVGCGDAGISTRPLSSAETQVVALIDEPAPLYRDFTLPLPMRTDFLDAVPLTMQLTLTDASDACRPIAGALVQAWQCNPDAAGNYARQLTHALQITDCNGQAGFDVRCPGSGGRIHVRAYLRGVLDVPPESMLLPRDLVTAIYDASIHVIRDGTIRVSADDALSPNVRHQVCSTAVNATTGGCDVSLSVGLAL